METYNHIELTEDETIEAMIWRKRKKEDELKAQAIKEREDQNRKRLTAATTYDIVKSLMLHRLETKFGGKFILDDTNKILFELLCAYFGNDLSFLSTASSMGVVEPSLDKGILLAGNFGVGKTWFMQLFQQNQRQVFYIKNCKDIANEFMESGESGMGEYIELKQNPINDSSLLFQKVSGLCLDDLGTEDIKNHYGNKKNVVGDLLEQKYEKRTIGVYLHGTTNLTAEQLKEFYGNRVISRMKAMFNFVELKGRDRRK